jgi:excinuclease ABC subunit C
VSRARARARALGLPLPASDLAQLRAKVRALAENRPGTYRMLDATGGILYVGKAKRVRTRLLSYFRAEYPAEKASRILHASHDIQWDYTPSEFSAYLSELRQIRRYRPRFNVTLNRTRRSVLVKVGGGPAPRVYVGAGVAPGDLRAYGPFRSLGRTVEAVRTLNDLLQLRDCAEKMPIAFAGQGDLFGEPRRAGCARHELGFCTGPCGGFVAEWEYRLRLETALAFLEGRTIQPIDRAVTAMTEAAAAAQFETATRWRDRFEQLEWLLAATSRARSAIDLLTFVYRDPGAFGDDRAFVIHRGVVRATFPYPTTPIEHEAFKAAVAEAAAAADEPAWPLPLDSIDEILLVMAWFRKHPEALRRTTTYAHWIG